LPFGVSHGTFVMDIMKNTEKSLCRTGFEVEAARLESRRRELLRFLESDTPAWEDENHPELSSGSAAWVERLRNGNERN
jgi:hypothetical protein